MEMKESSSSGHRSNDRVAEGYLMDKLRLQFFPMMTVELLILSGLLQVETQCITGIPREYGHYLSVHWNGEY
eukprot:scaffold55929_cov23-Tisochrysis_lutea.AAC.1